MRSVGCGGVVDFDLLFSLCGLLLLVDLRCYLSCREA